MTPDRHPHEPDLSAIDAGLRALPLAPAPPTLLRGVMTRVRALAQPRFALSWLDLALPLFAAVCLTLLIALGLDLWRFESGVLVIRLTQTSLVALQRLGLVTSLLLALGLVTVFATAILAGLTRWVWRSS